MKKNQRLSLKFTIKSLIKKYPRQERAQVQLKLTKILGVSLSTLERIMYAQIGSSQSFTAENLLRLATFFNVPPTDILSPEYKDHLNSILFFED